MRDERQGAMREEGRRQQLAVQEEARERRRRVDLGCSTLSCFKLPPPWTCASLPPLQPPLDLSSTSPPATPPGLILHFPPLV